MGRNPDLRTGVCISACALLCSVRDGDTVKHYRIRQLDAGGLFIARRVTFHTLSELVEHYNEDADGLCVNLRKPCLLVGGFLLSTISFFSSTSSFLLRKMAAETKRRETNPFYGCFTGQPR